MDEMPPLSPGFVRVAVRLPRRETFTPGQLVKLVDVPLDQIGPVWVQEDQAFVDVRSDLGKTARTHLERLGPTRLVDWLWQWLRLGIGRNHGLSIGQFKKIMQAADALPLGRIVINNTHTLVGLQDFKIDGVVAKLALLKINGFAARPEALPQGHGPGSAAYIPHAR